MNSVVYVKKYVFCWLTVTLEKKYSKYSSTIEKDCRGKRTSLLKVNPLLTQFGANELLGLGKVTHLTRRQSYFDFDIVTSSERCSTLKR